MLEFNFSENSSASDTSEVDPNKEVIERMSERVEVWKRYLAQHTKNLDELEESEHQYDAGWNSGLKVFLEDEIDYWQQLILDQK